MVAFFQKRTSRDPPSFLIRYDANFQIDSSEHLPLPTLLASLIKEANIGRRNDSVLPDLYPMSQSQGIHPELLGLTFILMLIQFKPCVWDHLCQRYQPIEQNIHKCFSTIHSEMCFFSVGREVSSNSLRHSSEVDNKKSEGL